MRLSFSTNAFTRHSVFYAIEKIADAGYMGVEILADTPHLYAPTVTESDISRLQNLLGKRGIQVSNVNANTAAGYYGRDFWEPLFEPSMAHPDEKERRWRIDYTKRCIDIAQAVGSPCVSVTSGRMVPGIAPDESLSFLRGSLCEVLDYAMKKEIRIGIEYEPGLLIERCDELASIIDEIGAPHLGANLDLGHSHVLGEDPESVIGTLASRIFHIHLEDIRSRKHYHLIPGQGDMDFGMLFSILRQHSYGGFVTVELYTYPHMAENAARESLMHLQAFSHDTHNAH